MAENVKSIWQILYDHLTAEGFDVYSPGQHLGECRAKYVVLKDAGAARLNSYSTDANNSQMISVQYSNYRKVFYN